MSCGLLLGLYGDSEMTNQDEAIVLSTVICPLVWTEYEPCHGQCVSDSPSG
uniref:Uncharacterized protein n=1 Tax=Anguilla anguilla TaxID=7936 RepID=A0A0E9TXU4_ANGAN